MAKESKEKKYLRERDQALKDLDTAQNRIVELRKMVIASRSENRRNITRYNNLHLKLTQILKDS